MMDYQQRISSLSEEGLEYLAEQLGLHKGIDQLIAYYVCDDSVETGALDTGIRNKVKSTLPDQLHPAEYIALDQLPKLPNGKVDLNSLPEPARRFRVVRDVKSAQADRVIADTDMSGDKADVSNSDNLVSLIAILETLLGIGGILPTDNYFEIGGDSITAIRLVSRAREAGINISVSALTKYPDFAALARSIDEVSDSVQTERGSLFGDAPLTPIQAWFFSHDHPRPEHWCIGGRYSLAKGTDNTLLMHSIRDCLSEHKELAARFKRTDGRWHCSYPDNVLPENIVSIAGSGEFSSITELVCASAESFSLTSGWMLKFIVIDSGTSASDELVWVAHHLIVDQISIATLMREIENRYQGKESGSANNALAMREWAVACDMTTPAELLIRGTNSEVSPVYSQVPAAEVCVVRTEQSFDVQTTEVLLKIVEHRSCSMSALLLTALSVAWQSVFGNVPLALDIEGHGRDLISTDLDNSNTLGWFSAFHPADLPSVSELSLQQCESVQQQLDEQKETNSQHLIRCVNNGEEKFSDNGRLLFNYLGVTEPVPEGSLFTPQSLPSDGLRSDENIRPHNIELNSVITDKLLTVVWINSVKGNEEHKTKQLMDNFYRNVVEFSNECSTSLAAMQTDFPDISMNQSDLDDFLDSIE